MNEMKYLDLDKSSFLRNYKKIQKRFHRKLQDYIKNPSDENIHDIRVAVRRLETVYRILPKNVRQRKKITNYEKQAKILFKLNAKIRDYDIICAKMESRYKEETHDLVTCLKNSRIEKLHSANEDALKILRKSTPKISVNMIKKSKLNKRYFKVLGKIELDIQKNTIIALGDEKKIEELHRLRKDFKKLRYTLELAPNKGKTVQILNDLKKIQEMLGDIHDSDIIIDYIKSIEQNSRYLDIIESEVLERNKKYQAFVTTFSRIRPKAGYF